MRITYRARGVKEYWATRWEDIPADEPMQNLNVYPLKYAEMTVRDKDAKILEAGCGAGRLLRYYHNRGYNIVGIDFIEIAINKLKKIDPNLKVELQDIKNLKFSDQSFKYVLAFGLYHNLEFGLEKSIQETYRVLEKAGKVCASFRADNFQTRFTDYISEKKSKGINSKKNLSFHKMNLTRGEYEKLFIDAGFIIEFIGPVENMPFLYKFSMFRSKSHKKINENIARAEGYSLSWMGQLMQNTLMRFFPDQFCNIYVIIASKV
jgi:SAM-dependent methyltransferase